MLRVVWNEEMVWQDNLRKNCSKTLRQNCRKQAKNVLTHAGAYTIIGGYESEKKCQAKAPAKHFEDKKQDTPVVARVHECGRTSA